MAEDEEAVLVCLSRVKRPIAPYRKSFGDNCGECNVAVWVTPASIISAGPDATLICVECAHVNGVFGNKFEPQTEAQKKEFRESL